MRTVGIVYPEGGVLPSSDIAPKTRTEGTKNKPVKQGKTNTAPSAKTASKQNVGRKKGMQNVPDA